MQKRTEDSTQTGAVDPAQTGASDSTQAGASALAASMAGVLELIERRVELAERATIAQVARDFYDDVDPDELAERNVGDLFGALVGQWRSAQLRPARTANVRVFNPTVADHGWHCSHTIIEIENDDMPFLVDSVTMEINRRGSMLHLIVHPIVTVQRDERGRLIAYRGRAERHADDGASRESWMRVEIDRMSEAADREALRGDLERVLADVRATVQDWPQMLQAARDAIEEVSRLAHAGVDAAAVASAREFLQWLVADHFTFAGYRCHDLIERDGGLSLKLVEGSALGVLRTGSKQTGDGLTKLPPYLEQYARLPEPLVLTKSNLRATVHRPGYLDYVGVKRFDAQGRVCGEHRFLGLYTSKAYSAPVAQVPLLKQKVAQVMATAGLAPNSHAAKSLAHILETFPREELFQIDAQTLRATALGILRLGERQQFRLFVRPDPYRRFVVCLIFVPREAYATDVRRKLQAILLEAFHGESSEVEVNLSQAMVARVMITVRTAAGAIPEVNIRALEARLEQAARRWDDQLKQALNEVLGESRGTGLLRQFGTAFPAAYREDFDARAAVADVEMLAQVRAGAPLGMALYRPLEGPADALRFKLAVAGHPMALSDGLPMLERLGVRVIDERPYRIVPADGVPIWLHDFGLIVSDAAQAPIESLRAVFEPAFAAVYAGRFENDEFNRLVVLAGMPIEDVVLLRVYARYLRQIGFALSQSFIEATLAQHPALARQLVRLFKARFDPAANDDAVATTVVAELETALDGVDNLNEDRALRQLLASILATTRTNYFRRDANGAPRPFLSIKLDPAKVPGMPEPKPMFEIFVYSARFEGVHLRGGKVARGGLRWSDRPEDYRTEVLGLMKAQMVKNTVIVPVGSKGGFVLKRAPSPADRDAFMKEGVACYQDYLRGLLDVTDNLVDGRVVPPPAVRRHDPDDPYLVVAADKGTATFSDYANGIAKEYGFWLDDAFASGGSAGYDHKKMAITSRGAWESAQRHFRELGIDIRSKPFTVVGIGDMSGDVFGNGLLRSSQAKLIAAFDHRHIFIDPDPDSAVSYAERERLFNLPRSSWGDYDKARISAGGGVWPRSAKTIAVSPQARAALGIEAATLSPNELVSAILKAPVDLLFNGGIGTFVKASTESHGAAGDRANDASRVDGKDLRCRIVCEGGNLGFTQSGRIEYAMTGAGGKGGRINTDAIDNSAGVETSDHEVNIKILLGLVSADGEMTEKQRNTLLREMTDDVAKLVLRDNTFQNQSLSLTRRIAPELLDGHARFIQFLERSGRLNRALEFLPGDDEIAERRARKQGLTMPELAVLLAYSKIWLYDELLASDVPDDPWVATALIRYFPKLLGDRYSAYMPRHPLKREIIATHVVNSMVNRVGSIFVHRLMDATGAPPADIVRAYLLAREVFGYVPLWQAVEALDWEVSEDVLAELLLEAARHPPATSWFLRSRRLHEDMGRTIEVFRPHVQALEAALPTLLEDVELARRDAMIERHVRHGVPRSLATQVASLRHLGGALDMVEIAGVSARPFAQVASVYAQLGARLGLAWIAERIAALPADSHWQYRAKNAYRDELAAIHRDLAAAVLADASIGGVSSSGAGDPGAPHEPGSRSGPDLLGDLWLGARGSAMERTMRVLDELRSVRSPDAAMLSVGLRALRDLLV